MQALGVSASEVMGALQAQNMEVPAGRVERGTQEQLVRVLGRITDPAQFAGVIVGNRDGQPIRLGDVALIEDGTEEERSLALVNGERAVSLANEAATWSYRADTARIAAIAAGGLLFRP